jgi:hypothetical protein
MSGSDQKAKKALSIVAAPALRTSKRTNATSSSAVPGAAKP